MLGPDPQGAQTVQQPLQAHVSNTTGSPAIGNVDVGGGAVVGEQVAALPLRGDVGVGHRLQPGAQDGLVQVLGVAELGLALARGFPVLRQQADHRLAASIGLLQRLLPPSPQAGSRCAGPDPRRSHRPDPVPARSATVLTATAWRLSRLEWLKNTRATSAIFARVEMSRASNRLLEIRAGHRASRAGDGRCGGTVACTQSLGRMRLLCRRSQGGCRCGRVTGRGMRPSPSVHQTAQMRTTPLHRL